MIRPYYNLDDDRGRQHGWSPPRLRIGSPLTPAVKGLMIACAAVFVFQMILGPPGPLRPPSRGYDRFSDIFAFNPVRAILGGRIWQFATYIFLHGGFLHIAVNMFVLWMFGGAVEMRLGRKRFLWLFFLAGIVGALCHAVSFWLPYLVGGQAPLGMLRPFADPADFTADMVRGTVGASGSIMGVAAACGMLYPNTPVLAFFIIPMKMKHFVILLAVLDVMMAAHRGGNVAHYAHLGGLGAGYLFIRYEPRVGPVFTRLYYRLKGRFRGFSAGGGSVRIDDDAEYQREVDRILDKIFREGTTSLSKEENEFLKKSSERYKKQ
jgi:membrane associated rhomboid family serine protease